MAALHTLPEHREFPFTLREYRRLAAFIHGRTGITLPDHKINMVYSRLTRRLRELGFSTFAEYCDYYSSPEGEAEIVKAQCLNGRLVAGDIAAMILFLASDDSAYITGSVIPVGGGDLG